MQKKIIAGAAALVALGLSAGGAYTASNTTTGVTALAGYSSTTVSGATVNSVDYAHTTDGTQIDSATIVFAGDLTGKNVAVGFGSTANKTCTLGTYNATALTTTATCSALAQSVSTADQFNISVVS